MKKIDFSVTLHWSKKAQVLLVLFTLAMVLFYCSDKEQKTDTDGKVHPKVEKLKLLPDFHADHLYSPGENEQGSWVAMAFDDKGRMIACDQYGYLYRLTIPPV
ncbi:MAG: hypothetical protein ACXWCG_03860, partial [Flavitalea sp.]